MTAVSVIIRAKDEAQGIGRTLELLAAQSQPPHETIVVDSGSRDATVAIARDHGADVIEIPAESFSFGGALNTGCEAATGEVLVALSAHAFPTDRDWVAMMAAAFDEDDVACACGLVYSFAGGLLEHAVRQDAAHQRRHPRWGYTNSAGGFRADLWRQRPWRTDLASLEDKEWALHWMERGMVAVIDPRLAVEHSHAHDPLLSQYRRARRDAIGYAKAFDPPPYGLRGLVREWWSETDSYESRLKARLSHRRAVRLAGEYAGRRTATR